MSQKRSKNRRGFRRSYARKVRRTRKETGHCVHCGKHPPIPGVTNCRECILRKLASKHLGSSSKWQELEKLYIKQERKCAYTGRTIEIGRGASIEHLIPTSKDGAGDIHNIRWVDRRINMMKGDMSLWEFVERCASVLSFFCAEGLKHV